MNHSSPDRFTSTINKQTEHASDSNERALLKDAENKIRILDGFLLTGDMASDYNYFLEITHRNINYKKATSESNEDLLKNLENIKVSLLENQNERINDISTSEASQKFYKDLPNAEIGVITKLIEFYQ